MHFVSRYKRIVKIHGIPVYPMEIEQLVVAQQNVSDACAVPVQGKNNEQEIVLFVESQDKTLTETLPALIEQKISVFAKPARVVLVEKFPLTNVSKIDTKKLIELL